MTQTIGAWLTVKLLVAPLPDASVLVPDPVEDLAAPTAAITVNKVWPSMRKKRNEWVIGNIYY